MLIPTSPWFQSFVYESIRSMRRRIERRGLHTRPHRDATKPTQRTIRRRTARAHATHPARRRGSPISRHVALAPTRPEVLPSQHARPVRTRVGASTVRHKRRAAASVAGRTVRDRVRFHHGRMPSSTARRNDSRSAIRTPSRAVSSPSRADTPGPSRTNRGPGSSRDGRTNRFLGRRSPQ